MVQLQSEISPRRTPEIIAHRGASFDAPENTMASFRLAWVQNADAIECDVLLSRDGKIVVLHDTDTKRLAGVQKTVTDQTLDELQSLDVGKWKGKAHRGERIPTLEEVLAIVPADKRVLIEVKCGPEIVPELDRVLRASKLHPAQTPIISFSAQVIAAVKTARPDLPAYFLACLRPREQKTATAEELIQQARQIQADGLDLSAADALNADFASKVKAAGLKTYVWTVNDLALARRMVEIGVDGITTDRPAWLREQLGSPPRKPLPH